MLRPCIRDGGMSCRECWDREIPEATAVEFETYPNIVEAAKRLADSALKTGDVIKNVAKALTENAPHILDSGDRTEFATGAVRDMREGKGRCDLMPLEVVAHMFTENPYDEEPVLNSISDFKGTDNTDYLYDALVSFCKANYHGFVPTMLLEVAKHFEEGAKKYGENNWQKGIPVKCYIDSAVRHYLKWLRG